MLLTHNHEITKLSITIGMSSTSAATAGFWAEADIGYGELSPRKFVGYNIFELQTWAGNLKPESVKHTDLVFSGNVTPIDGPIFVRRNDTGVSVRLVKTSGTYRFSSTNRGLFLWSDKGKTIDISLSLCKIGKLIE